MKTKSQSGRSMVEMLGVLAIIGVLSVGGIAGYSLSMRRHRANQIVDTMSKHALVLYNSCQRLILDGKVSSVEGCVGRSSEDIPGFEDTAVGPIPAGVTGFASPYFSTNATTGVDIVHVDLSFSDQKLCQAVASIAGTACNGNNVVIKFNQN